MSKEYMTRDGDFLNNTGVEAEIPEQREHSEPKPKKATVKCSYNVALRKKPNRKGQPLRAVKDGTKVDVLGKENDYSRVRVDGIVGYIASEFLI